MQGILLFKIHKNKFGILSSTFKILLIYAEFPTYIISKIPITRRINLKVCFFCVTVMLASCIL